MSPVVQDPRLAAERGTYGGEARTSAGAARGEVVPTTVASGLDALLPPDMALRAEKVGVRKAHLPVAATSALGVLAGAFIALGGVFSTTVVAGAADVPYGIRQLLAGLTFSLGLVLVLVGGAELFTGNTMLVMAWAGRKLRSRSVVANWALVYAANFVGAVATAALVFMSGQFANGNGSVGAAALAIAERKLELGFIQAVALGMLCNALVCLAVWLGFSARSTTDRVVSTIPPVAAFVAAGFEHSVANMYFLPIALFIKAWAPQSFWLAIGKSPADFADLTWARFLAANLAPVTLGNVIGGGVMVAGVYWFVYLRRRASGPEPARARSNPD
jgi:formate/nitrite transporter